MRHPILPALSAIVLISLTACGQAQSEQPAPERELEPAAATAELDPITGDIAYPLDDYRFNLEETNTIDRASSIRMQQCMQENGHDVDLLTGFTDRTYAVERPYGAWNVELAKEWGYGLPDEGPEQINLSEQGPAFNKQWDDCGTAMNQAQMDKGGFPRPDQMILPIESEAARAARNDPAWETAVSEWKTCLEDGGIAMSFEDEFVPERAMYEDSKAKEIRLAVADTKCKAQTNLVQRLADLEASYQAALIPEHESELQEARQSIDVALQEARTTIKSFTPAG